MAMTIPMTTTATSAKWLDAPAPSHAKPIASTQRKSLGACLFLVLALGLALVFLVATTERAALEWKGFATYRAIAKSNGSCASARDHRHSSVLFEAAPPKSTEGGPCSADDDDDDRYGVTSTPSSSYPNNNTDCARSFTLPHSVITKHDAARARCTSSWANVVRTSSRRGCASAHNNDHNNDTHNTFIPASICVFYLNYRNLANLVTSVTTHAMRSFHPDLVSHTVLTMDEDEADVVKTRQALGSNADVHRLHFPPGTRGGDPLPLALRLISLLSSCPLTVVSDSDAFMLKDGWDQRLLTVFLKQPELALFASNPRHHSHGEAFRDVAEWNWMAYRTAAFAGLVIGGGPTQHIDVGHYYSSCVDDRSQTLVHLKGTAWPYEGKAATVVTDTDGSPWILHLFYASRHANEPDDIKAEARKYSLSDDQLAELRFNLTQTRCLDPRVAFG